MKCDICAESSVGLEHEISEKHIKNKVLYEYAQSRKQFAGNRKGAAVTCSVKSSVSAFDDCTDAKIKISAKPQEELTFKFTVKNESKKENIVLIFVQTAHNKLNFTMSKHGLEFGCSPVTLKPKEVLQRDISVSFKNADIGQYEMPIIFSFRKPISNEGILIMRDMVVYVEEQPRTHDKIISPYTKKEVTANKLYKSTIVERSEDMFRIPKNYKPIYGNKLRLNQDAPKEQKQLCADIKEIFATGVTPENYVRFFHNLLWYEETIVRINLKNYNMTNVQLLAQGNDGYALVVPGLAEKRPSLMMGDIIFVKPHNNEEVMFEAAVAEISGENVVTIRGLHQEFGNYYSFGATYDVRFFMSRMPLERMHRAIQDMIVGHPDQCRVFPKRNPQERHAPPIDNYFNPLVEQNEEQRRAVEHMVAGSSGAAPYLLHGPPGTGKTVTIVEAILQIVMKNPNNRVLVCTDSNMAADHVATLIMQYAHMFQEHTLLKRASSKFRVWETLPLCLAKYSNGTSRENFAPVNINEFMSYSIVVTTLSHAAKFVREIRQRRMERPITHLFIDEAAQASEPSSLIPVTGLLQQSRGRLVLAGDPLQLGPVVISRHADKIGLGLSLMERLKNSNPLYNSDNNDPHYTLMLRNNFRSDPDILEIPNDIFYKGHLRYHAQSDPISKLDILGLRPTSRAIVFHGVLSKEQRMGKSPSFFNTMELEIVQMYVRALVLVHKVPQEDIGIVTPYIRQVYKVKQWLETQRWGGVEVGTVEAFQGKEKRVVVISTVRANASLLDHDARFQLGFLVDDKRFNVALTRAKAKAIIIGNPLCLERDAKWRAYMNKCREFGTYFGYDTQAQRTEATRQDIVDKINPLLKDMKISKGNKTKG